MISQYNRQQARIFPLNHRGYKQAQRNNSHQIWSLLSWEEEIHPVQFRKEHEQTFQTTANDLAKLPKETQQPKKQVSFKISRNQQQQLKQQFAKTQTTKRPNSFVKSGYQKVETTKQPAVETQLEKLKKKSIQKYLKEQIPFSRTLSNSAFRKFYQRPCPQAYGSKNTSTQRGAFYGNFMKTHNIQPHTLDNKPENYQTFISALNFGKRTKLDLEDRWKRIQRQLAKNLDYRQLVHMKAIGEVDVDQSSKADVLKQNINIFGPEKGKLFQKDEAMAKSAKSLGKMETRATFNGQQTNRQQTLERSASEEKKRSRSSDRPLYYIYKYKQSEDGYDYTRYARDRHGITCYVDNCFRQNDQAFTHFLKKIKPIYPQKCKPEDINIDKIRIQNSDKHKNQQLPRHYLMPNVQTAYVAGNYSRKKAQSLAQTLS